MTKPLLLLTLGYPGSGKTHVSEMLASELGFVHFHADRIRAALIEHPQYTLEEHRFVFDHIDELMTQSLQSGESVVYDANHNKLRNRLPKYALCRQVGANAAVLWVQTPIEVAWQRVNARPDDDYVNPRLSRDVFDRMLGEIEPPVEEPVVILNTTVPVELRIRELLFRLSELGLTSDG